jgi:hypothetical protein
MFKHGMTRDRPLMASFCWFLTFSEANLQEKFPLQLSLTFV